MLSLNVVLVVVLVSVFSLYVKSSRDNVLEVSVNRVADNAASIVGQMENYISNQADVVNTYGGYIEEQQLTYQDTIDYLKHWNSFYASVSVVNAGSYQGTTLEGDNIYEQSFANASWAKKVCDSCRYEAVDNTTVHMSDVFYMESGGENAVAFYQTVKIEGQQYVIFFIFPMSILQNCSNDWGEIDATNGIAIDMDGNVLFGDMPDSTEADQNNYYLFTENTIGRDVRNTVWNDVHNGTTGEFLFKDKSGEQWICVFRGIDGTNGWTYMYHIRRSDVENSSSIRVVVVIFVLMMAWLLIDIAAYYIYNRKLRGVLRIVEEQNEDLKVANMAKNVFISNMSHEIRTPINAVLGMDEMIIRECDDDTIRSYAHDIRNAGKVLLGIINDVLDYSKIDSGKMEIVPVEYALSSVINDIFNMIDIRAREKHLKLDVIVNPQTPSVLYGDELRLKQIIINILTNAVKYTEKGGVVFTIDYENVGDEEIDLLVSVKDTGIGMKQEDIEKLSVAFERFDEKRNRHIEGTGLGMSIVTRLLEQMGSQLKVESVYGEGSTFSFALRQRVLDRAKIGGFNAIRQERDENKSGVEQESILSASKARILAVDDTQVNLTVVKGLLKRTGAQVDCAMSGQECLDMCEKTKYDLIFLDHRMPQMDGIETLKRLKELPNFDKTTPVIALTANVVSGAREMYISEGFTDFLAKPINGNRMERMLINYLPKSCQDSEEDVAAAISRESGIEACGSEKVYDQVTRQFVQLAPDNIREIRSLYDEQDVKNYTIKVHALKSSARFVGANQLSKEAASLEGSGNAGLWHEIEAGTDKLLAHYQLTVENLKKLIGVEEADDERPEIDPDILRSALSAIREFNGSFDFDSVDAVMKSLEQYRLPDDLDFEGLKTAVYNVDQETIENIVKGYSN